MLSRVEYIWMDGAEPTQKLRSKTRVLPRLPKDADMTLGLFPDWGFDGSSTSQSLGKNSDLILHPVRAVMDPIRGMDSWLVMCEVMNVDGTPHKTNTRALLRDVLKKGASDQDPWFGFEQEYTLLDETGTPLGWPPGRGVPAPQGPYYCGVGSDEVFGRPLVEEHLTACMMANVMIYGINAEVMPGQWEFQIGYRPGIDSGADPLLVADHLWLARWLLYRISENYNLSATLAPKLKDGDWNGAGMHTNFSTVMLRDETTGPDAIKDAISKLEENHANHIAKYGHGNERRLTGLHETCDINTFKHGALDRGASIRIPEAVAKEGCGYLEDRRPAANADPYVVAAAILETICL